MQIIFASGNDNKIKEIKQLLGNSFDLLSLKDLNIDEEIPEDEPTLEGNALFKARFLYKFRSVNVFSDDTGLEIDALNGQPGVLSARFAGDDKDSNANIEKVLQLLGDTEKRKARFRTVIALILDGKEYLFEGIINGEITTCKRGAEGFGYDPIFIPAGKNLTFAEMDLEEKNTISHRAIAFNKLKQFLFDSSASNNKDLC